MAKTNEIATKTEQVNLSSPSAVMDFATNLKDLIVQNNLFTSIKGKNYVNVEGWQIAGAFTGTFPIVENVENLSDGKNYKYRAEVSLRDAEGKKVGYGVAICTNKENGKTGFDEYAVASMAQTRAVGKAYRMKIGWLLKVAGYETTPAEEMDAVAAEVIDKPKSRYSIREIGIAKKQLEQAKDIDELKEIYVGLGPIRNEDEVIAKKDKMKAKLNSEKLQAELSDRLAVITASRGGEE
ncbi:MAG: hypothetical protein K6G49_02175 [Candidatus Saccharibacteria bacterium]|nr:hypothetical protein [Candidatus Saccharibacteria bacterium]